MVVVDTSGNPRIPVFLEMARRMSSARNPNEVLAAYLGGMRGAYGMEAYIRIATRGLPPGKYRVIRMVNAEQPDFVDAREPDCWDDHPVREGGFLGSVLETAEPKLIHSLDLHADPVLGDAFDGCDSALAVPMYIDGEAAQWIVLLHQRGDAFEAGNLEEWLVRINMLSSNVRTAIIARELRDATRWIKSEISTIADIQRALLPARIPRIPGIEGAAHYETFEHAGGDYYDFRPLRVRDGQPDPNGPWAIIVADAAGHGPAAAVVMAMLRTLFHGYGHESSGPASLLEHCNRHLNSADMRFAFVTAFAAVYDPAARTLCYARAGHEPPLIARRNAHGTVDRLDAVNGYPLGVADRVDSGEAVVELAHGHTLVLYTDGITESFSPDGEMFRVEGIERVVAGCNGEADCVVSTIVEALKRHEAGVRPRDDQTLVALRALEQ